MNSKFLFLTISTLPFTATSFCFDRTCTNLSSISHGPVRKYSTDLPTFSRANKYRNRQTYFSLYSLADSISSSSTQLNAATLDSPVIEDTKIVSKIEDKTTQLDWKSDNFVFGLESSGLSRPKGKVAQIVVEGDDLETTPAQLALVTSTLLTHAIVAAISISGLVSNHGIISGSVLGVMTAVASYISADLGSGVLHWSVDNYGNGRTPIFGSIIAAFQGHHSAQWTITQRGLCNNVHKLCTPFGIPTILAISALFHSPTISLFFAVFCAAEIMSQEFHKWSHMTKGEAPGLVNWLQEVGFILGRREHALHHIAPYGCKYCIVNGFCNEFLDSSGIFRRFEHQIYKWNGVESNAMKLDPKLREKTLSGKYSLD
eukprot:CAMPEP_0113318542 /NCGR_PEP_ID=MMETSP0010_2-20120614/13073_1 /TAXON_ID=216773 ORGANISM="Corethron hystrix, Strain 308" /NCGR_SAMPLE_ID=MMETSP0010_2 /ASSEMBLY_ACC=CAM_ASM_000155 /LENGTH=371 /DNA_ID=CAMNT_0000175873 /DNA_START=194 /DNA_END=1309 /DNA_ORIENTATION=+ /assembly_acc=CAM_ASM_000155